jgi:uncharacterized membrane protein
MQIVSVLTLSAATGIRGEFHFAELSFAAFWPFVAAGAVGASFGKIFYYYGIDTVGASKSVSIKNSSPILTTILAVVILGERVTLPLAAGVVLIVAGIILLTRVQGRAEGSPNQIAYFIYPLLAAFCFGINPIVKKIGVSTVSVPTFGALITQTTALIVMLTAGRLLNIKLKWEKVPRLLCAGGRDGGPGIPSYLLCPYLRARSAGLAHLAYLTACDFRACPLYFEGYRGGYAQRWRSGFHYCGWNPASWPELTPIRNKDRGQNDRYQRSSPVAGRVFAESERLLQEQKEHAKWLPTGAL